MKKLVLFFLLAACSSGINQESLNTALLQVDKDFCTRSVEVGMNTAFYEYGHKDAVLLRDDRFPLKGIETIKENFLNKADDGFLLNWVPLHADVAESNDLGYTYGTWTVEIRNEEGDIIKNEGSYVSVWKKNAGGEWKWVLDCGTQGLKKEN